VRKAVEPPGEAKEDAWIISEISKRMGYPMPSAAEEIMKEINSTTPSYGGITYERLEQAGLVWPCPDTNHPGTPVLHRGKFSRGKGQFFSIPFKPPIESADSEYPFILSTGRVLEHYHTGTMTRRGTALNRLYPELLAEINPIDAERLGISEGDYITITSKRGSIRVKAKLSVRSQPGMVFVPFHFHEAAVNLLTHAAVDPVSKIPEYKVSAVKIEKAA
jgi:predicted molibdopterin-dependent oxidoreductase YjgC